MKSANCAFLSIFSRTNALPASPSAVQPSRPAAAIDAALLEDAFGDTGGPKSVKPHDAPIWATHTAVGGHKWGHVLVAGLADSFALLPRHLPLDLDLGTPTEPAEYVVWRTFPGSSQPTPSDAVHDFSAAAPLKTIGAAVAKATAHMAQSTAKATVVLKAGVYHGCDGKGNVCALGAAQSGLTITCAPGEDATITGGEPLAITAADWKRVPTKAPSGATQWKDMPNMNDVASRAGMPTPGSDTKCCKFLGVMQTDTLDACKAAAVAAGGNFAGVTYHTAAFGAPYGRHCYGVHQGDWIKPTSQAGIDSSQNMTGGASHAPVRG